MLQLGDSKNLGVTVTDTLGAAVDSPDIALAILKPDGTTDSIAHGSLTHDGIGLYSYLYAPAAAGRYVARFTSNTPTAAYEETFEVEAAFHAVGLVSRDEVKAALNIPATNTKDDDELDGYIVSATSWLEGQVGPVISGQRVDRIRLAVPTPSLLLPGWPVVGVTSVVNNADGSTVGSGDYYLTDGGQLLLTPTATVGSRWPSDVTVTYTVGQDDTALIRHIALELIEHWWQGSQQAGSLGGQIASGDEYDQTSYTPPIPDRVALLLATVRRPPGVR